MEPHTKHEIREKIYKYFMESQSFPTKYFLKLPGNVNHYLFEMQNNYQDLVDMYSITVYEINNNDVLDGKIEKTAKKIFVKRFISGCRESAVNAFLNNILGKEDANK